LGAVIPPSSPTSTAAPAARNTLPRATGQHLSKHNQLLANDEILTPALPWEQRGWGRLKRILGKFPSESIEIYGAFGMLALGLWFCLPGIRYPTGGVLTWVYDGHTWVWGPVLLTLGGYKTWAVLWGYKNRLHRLIAACLAGGAFSLILFAYVEHQPDHAMLVIMGVWICQQGYIAWRSQRTWRTLRS
jgi:hypothetical protein